MMQNRLPSRVTAGSLGRGVLYATLGTWFVATLVSQDPLRRTEGFLRKYDPSGLLIADWRFFAPVPGMDDNHLLYRDELADGSMTSWKEVEQDRDRKLSQMLFYPTRRSDKAITDAVSSLIQTAIAREDDMPVESIQFALPYLALLNFITHQRPHLESAVKTEFTLATSAGFDDTEEPEMLFLSNRHALR